MSRSFRTIRVRRDRFGRFSKRGRTITKIRVPVKTRPKKRAPKKPKKTRPPKKEKKERAPEPGPVLTLKELEKLQKTFDEFEQIDIETSADYAMEGD